MALFERLLGVRRCQYLLELGFSAFSLRSCSFLGRVWALLLYSSSISPFGFRRLVEWLNRPRVLENWPLECERN